jgi:hypothetical protein
MIRRQALLVLIAMTGVVACASSSTATPDTVTTPTFITTTTTVPDTTTTSTTPPTTTSTTTTLPPTTTTEPPVTTESPVLRELILRGDGLGTASFGADPDGVVAYVSSFLGSPTRDTGWIAPDSFALCPGDAIRRIEWGVLKLSFGDVSDFGVGRRHFYGWEYGLDGQLGDEPQGLRTVGGATLGTRVVDLRAEFPEVFVEAGEEGLFPPAWYVSDYFNGYLTGITDDDIVVVMLGGYFCGE